MMNLNSYRFLVPLGLAVAAGALNWMAMTSGVKPFDLVAVKEDVKAGKELTENMLIKISVRADRKLLLSAVPYEQRAMLYNRRVQRTIKASEILVRTDLEEGIDALRDQLRPGEMTLGLTVREACVTSGLQPGEWVRIFLTTNLSRFDREEDGSPSHGPFRVLGARPRVGTGNEVLRHLDLAVPENDPKILPLTQIQKGENVQRVERVHQQDLRADRR